MVNYIFRVQLGAALGGVNLLLWNCEKISIAGLMVLVGLVGLLHRMVLVGLVHTSYLSFFLHRQNFWRMKFTPKNA